MLRVFLSSTSVDLREHREACAQAIQKLEGYRCVRMEDFGARRTDPAAFSAAKVAECDLFLAVIGHSHGSCPPGSERSFTELEYEAAIAHGKPCLIFFAAEDAPVRHNHIETDTKRAKQSAFRTLVASNHVRDEFRTADDLAKRLTTAIHNWWRECGSTSRLHADAPAAQVDLAADPAAACLPRQTPKISVTLRLFEQRLLEHVHYPALKKALCDEFGWREERAFLARYVLGELLNNAFEHGCQGAGESMVSFSVAMEKDGQRLVIVVDSPGKGFNPASVLRDEVDDSGERSRGYGLTSVKKMVDSFISNSDGRRIQVTMERESRELRPHLRSPITARIVPLEGIKVCVVPMPPTMRREDPVEIDRKQIEQSIDENDVRGAIIDMTITDAGAIESGCIGVIIPVMRIFRQKGIPFVFAGNSGIVEYLRVMKFPGVFGSFEEASLALASKINGATG